MRTRSMFLAILLVAGTCATWAQAPADRNDLYRVNFVDVDITTLAETIARATGKTFVLHPQVHGLVTLTSERPLSAAQLYSAFAQTVAVKGYVVDEGGGVVNIYPGKPRK